MIGSRIVEGKTQEQLQGCSVIDLGFQLRVGVDVQPLLEEQAFHKDNWWVSFVSLGAFSDGMGSHGQVFDSGPIDDSIDLFHSFDGPIFFDRREEGDISEVRLGFIFLKPKSPPDGCF